MDDIESEANEGDFLHRNFLIVPVMINQIIYSALAVESYVNLLSSMVFSKKVFKKYYDRMPIYQKIGHVLEVGLKKTVSWRESPFKEIKELFDNRNKLVHDKGFAAYSSDTDIKEDVRRRDVNYSGEQAIKAVIEFSEYLKTAADGAVIIQEFVDSKTIEKWKAWNEKSCGYTAQPGTLYEGVNFPDVHEYQGFYRRHTGNLPDVDRELLSAEPI